MEFLYGAHPYLLYSSEPDRSSKAVVLVFEFFYSL